MKHSRHHSIAAESIENGKMGRRRNGVGDMGLALSARLISENRAVLAVRGCLNAVTAFPFKARIEGLVKEGRREIVCDLTEVGSLDSSGLAALIAGVRAAGERGGFFRFVVQTEQVARIFKLTMLDRVFEMYASVEAALGLSVDRAQILRAA